MALRSLRFLILISWFIPVLPIWPQTITSEVTNEVTKTYDEPEAKVWLTRPVPAFTPQAEKKERLERLVDWLYKDGAVFVGVVLTEWKVSGSGGFEGLRGLRIYMPNNKEAREQIFRVANRELVRSGYRSEDDTGQDTLMIWLEPSS